MIDAVILVSMHIVGVAMLLSLWRLLRGPTAPDRILALDTLYVSAIAQLMLLGMYIKNEIYFEAALIIAMLGFFGTLVLTKYVIRRDIVE
ncbi:K+/H+ antiporter subunit F [Lysobacteraceae bacterium NML75-0749]|nr:K+/H+ antiporter subunit F [Xanthomonadaceae bacterium NML03-0222]PJK02066.1 K+/H+ antiporter subunit F [Xanthomonadaceae bacterium NML75-0749]PJK03771.1 K+/H+ antiporter subunit F [Xanthomonadaceae bacterium NML71-0210]PJK04521.1 K+/H+ antiporter subunit F [Xanthomonadaceae bacterium NML91-0268]PJK14768.1 K+/H+ antiporter subunit F [Xanthomonadaceae bacterium NML07-0707]